MEKPVVSSHAWLMGRTASAFRAERGWGDFHVASIFSKRRFWGVVAAAASFAAPFAAPSPARASIFENHTRWPIASTGYVTIPVCIMPTSDTAEKGDGALAGLIHDPNPSLSQVITHVRRALSTSWEPYSSVRFTGFGSCDALSASELSNTIGLYIHKDAPNNSGVGTGSRGTVTASGGVLSNPGSQFKPWGNDFNRCIYYNASTTHVAYSFDCVEQYAIHEIGHALGFDHEWQHPLTPATCTPAPGEPRITGSYAATFDNALTYTIVNDQTYDSESIMVYGSDCANVTGVRFGSTTVDATDALGVGTVYPVVPAGTYDVGVIAGVKGCAAGAEPITVYMDDEDDNNQSSMSGWVGAVFVDRNTRLAFCRADGLGFKKLTPGAMGPRTGDYAVLKLGQACPPGAVEFTRYFDDEDSNNENYFSGTPGPNLENPGGGTGTELHFCLFRPENPAGTFMNDFPDLKASYGVFAAPDFVKALATGQIHTDDEDDNNQDRLDTPDEGTLAAVARIVAADRNTTLAISRVSLGVAAEGVGGLGLPVILPTDPGVCTVTVNNQNQRAGGCSGGVDLLSSCTFDGAPTEALGPGDHQIQIVASTSEPSSVSSTSYVRVLDREAPKIACPADIAVDGSAPDGAPVTFSLPAATDNCSAQPAVICSAPSGGTFPVGTTSVSCIATDSAAPPNSASCSFSVLVRSPAQTTQTLIAQIQALVASGAIEQGVGHSLLEKLEDVLEELGEAHSSTHLSTQEVCNKIHAFIQEVEARLNAGKLSASDGAALILSATHLSGALGC